jgi:hypothetical protein
MFDLQYITFGALHANQKEVCECCPKLKLRFTKETKIHASYICGHQNCGNSVCEEWFALKGRKEVKYVNIEM